MSTTKTEEILKHLYLDSVWKGWRYIWVCDPDFPEQAQLHEAYQCDPDYPKLVSWTTEPASPMDDSEALQEILALLEDGVIFSEEELNEHNELIRHIVDNNLTELDSGDTLQ